MSVKKKFFIYGRPVLAETDHKPCTASAKIGLINTSWRIQRLVFFFFCNHQKTPRLIPFVKHTFVAEKKKKHPLYSPGGI